MTQREVAGADAAGPGAGRRIILDACALLNLYASRRITEILASLPRPCAVADFVRGHEALWVGRQRSGPAADYERVDLRPLVASGAIEVLSLAGDAEFAHFVVLATSRSLADGEAMSAALAHSRGLVIATDDRAALAACARHGPPIPTCSTASLVRHWAVRGSVNGGMLRTALIDIRERASFAPSPHDPLCGWWQAVLAGS